METEMTPVTTEMRIKQLDLLTHGKTIVANSNNKQTLYIVAIITVITITGLVIGYESQRRKLNKKHEEEIANYKLIQEKMAIQAKQMAEVIAARPFVRG
jgi:uncharacterized membrane protein